MLYELARSDFGPEDIAFRIYRYTLGCACALHFEGVRDPIQHFAVAEVPDPDSPQPARMRGHPVGLGVRHIDEAVAQVDAARTAELLPLCNEAAVLPENLDANAVSNNFRVMMP